VIGTDIRILRYFLAVAREENITRAAETLHIAQPSLSRQLMELESELGKTLLLRGKRKITLTEDGVLLRKRAEEIVALLDRTESELRSDTVIQGEISVGGTPTPGILAAAAGLRREHPGVRFRFYADDAKDVMERLDHGSLDFAVLLAPADPVKYASVPLRDSSRWGLIMPADREQAKKEVVTPADLCTLPLVIHQRPGLQREIASWAGTEPERLHIAATYNVVTGDPSWFARSGLGCFLITEDHIPAARDADICFRPLEPPLSIRHVLVWKRHTAPGKAAEAFLRRIAEANDAALPDRM